jgi:hypothetical protein
MQHASLIVLHLLGSNSHFARRCCVHCSNLLLDATLAAPFVCWALSMPDLGSCFACVAEHFGWLLDSCYDDLHALLLRCNVCTDVAKCTRAVETNKRGSGSASG